MGYFLFVLCTWESVAIATNKLGFKGGLPTITRLLWELRDHGPWASMIVGAFTAWLWFHALIEGRP